MRGGWGLESLYGVVRKTPTEVGRCLRDAGCGEPELMFKARNPHRSGEVLARGKLVRSVSMVQTEKPPPKWGGACEEVEAMAQGFQEGEKPPPKWGVLCEWIALPRWPRCRSDSPPPEWDPPSLTTKLSMSCLP